VVELLKPGQVFAGRYRIEKFLAKGGFGAVYVAEQTETELRVAVKVLWPHVIHSADAVEKFKLEARIAGRVDSEHIVKVFDAGFDESSKMPFLVMELLQGADLESLVRTSGPVAPDKLVAYFRQIASALDKAHGYVDRNGARRPIVHRDLKPQNLFLNYRETGEPVIKVLDFGIAKVLSESTEISQEVRGTPLYMAFEQASAGAITPQTDVWSLGLIAFFLLTGRCYWKAGQSSDSSITQLYGEILSLPLDPPSSRAPALGAVYAPTPEFDAWFARCVERDAARRFRTAGEAAAALAAAFNVSDTHRSPGTFMARSAPSGVSAVSGPDSPVALGNTARPEQKRRFRLLLSLGAGAFVAMLAIPILMMRPRETASPEPSASTGVRSSDTAGAALGGVTAHGSTFAVAPGASAPTVAPAPADAGASTKSGTATREKVTPTVPAHAATGKKPVTPKPAEPAPPPLLPR
jgi:serine/threonine-protein kinase